MTTRTHVVYAAQSTHYGYEGWYIVDSHKACLLPHLGGVTNDALDADVFYIDRTGLVTAHLTTLPSHAQTDDDIVSVATCC